jgi:hypothetical protein
VPVWIKSLVFLKGYFYQEQNWVAYLAHDGKNVFSSSSSSEPLYGENSYDYSWLVLDIKLPFSAAL